jgi:hypothetical protein
MVAILVQNVRYQLPDYTASFSDNRRDNLKYHTKDSVRKLATTEIQVETGMRHMITLQ